MTLCRATRRKGIDRMSLLHTPLYDEHVALGGEMAAFCGYEVPAQYAGALEEHAAVRERAGLFDVSYMGRIRIVGPKET